MSPSGPTGLVVALDVPSLDQALRLIATLRRAVTRFKIGMELFTAAGPAAVSAVHDAGGDVFLDLKLHDIPNTVAGAVRSAARLGVEMLTLHLAGGEAMVRSAVDAARGEGGTPLLLGVTTLTSHGPANAGPGGGARDAAAAAEAAARQGVEGVVAAVADVPAIRAVCPPPFLAVTPGIRPAGADAGDQARFATPAAAVRAGSDLLVVGRPITRASDPLAAAFAILREMEEAGSPAAAGR